MASKSRNMRTMEAERNASGLMFGGSELQRNHFPLHIVNLDNPLFLTPKKKERQEKKKEIRNIRKHACLKHNPFLLSPSLPSPSIPPPTIFNPILISMYQKQSQIQDQ